MIEEEINELIIRMENLGYEFDKDDDKGIKFKTSVEGAYLFITDWDKVDKFVANYSHEEE